MRLLTVLTISLLMSSPAFAGSVEDCGNGVHADRNVNTNKSVDKQAAINKVTRTLKKKKIKGRQ